MPACCMAAGESPKRSASAVSSGGMTQPDNWIERSIQLSGCVIPPELTALADRFGDSPAAMQQAGILYASHQIIDLIANGCGHIHVYTMNKPEVAAGILNNLKGII